MSNIITTQIRADREYTQLLELVKKNLCDKPLPILAGGLTGGAQDALSISLCEDTANVRKAPMLVICSEEKECRRLVSDFSQFGLRTAFYINRDLTFYNMTASHEFEHERLRVLSGICDGGFDAVFTTPDAALGFTIPKSILKKNMISIDFDTRIEPSLLASRLVSAGYARVDMVEVAGQFALRGGIIDIYPPHSVCIDMDGEMRQGGFPIRIELFDDEIDRMGTFDPESQRMVSNVCSVTFTPAREILLDKDSLSRVEGATRECYKKASDPTRAEALLREMAALKGEISEIGFIDKYVSLVYPEKECLFDYFDERTVVLIRSSAAVNDRIKAEKRLEEENIKDIIERGMILPKYAEYSQGVECFEAFCDSNVTLHVNSLSYGVSDKRLSGMFGFRTRQPVSYADNYNLLCEDIIGYQHGGYKVIIMTENEKELIKLIRENDNPEQALMTATVIILGFLKQHESFEAQVPAYLQEHA